MKDKFENEFHELILHTIRFRRELTNESDRGCALLASSYLEFLLEKALRKRLLGNKNHLNNLFDFNGALGTFSSRIAIAYSIGLISEYCYNDLQIIRKIRNTYGHSPEIINFEDEGILKQCDNLKLSIRSLSVKPRQKFTTSVSFLIGVLNGIIQNSKKFEFCENEDLEKLTKIADNFDATWGKK